MSVTERLKELKLTLPDVQPAGLYQAAVRTGGLLFVSGQIPKVEGRVAYQGRVGREVTLDVAKRAAKACILNGLAAIQATLGSLDRIKRIVKINGYVSSAVGFTEQHKVMDGASELLIEIFGSQGEHARAAVGVTDLPLRACVEIEMIVEV